MLATVTGGLALARYVQILLTCVVAELWEATLEV
jgi:hypothetical protein